MAVKRNATWNIKKKAVVNTLADARADVLKNLQADIAELIAAGNIIKTKRINPDFTAGYTQVWLGRGVYQAEVIEIDTVVLAQLLTDLQSVESDITAGLYDAGISSMQEKMTTQMSTAQEGRNKVNAWVATLSVQDKAAYKLLKIGSKRAAWRKANGYK